jgi:hypothetical protein
MPGRARLALLLSLLLLFAGLLFVRSRAPVPASAGVALGYTECPLMGDPRVTISPHLPAQDTLPVRRHEEVHARQCRELGAVRYRLRNFTGRGRLSLEAPAYCAGARARIESGLGRAAVRERLIDDAGAAFRGIVETAAVQEALRLWCADILATANRQRI